MSKLGNLNDKLNAALDRRNLRNLSDLASQTRRARAAANARKLKAQQKKANDL